jgi:YcaO-like protein with predicted kinase domain
LSATLSLKRRYDTDVLWITGEQAPKSYRRGTHRLVAPSQTLDRVVQLAPAMGITRLANVTGLDCIGIPVVMACRPNARSVSVSQGKGLDLDAAKASGLMEAVEGYHAEHILKNLKLASYEEIRYSHNVIDVSLLPELPGQPFHGDLLLTWIEGQDLLTRESSWVPFELVHANYTVGSQLGARCFAASSNGLASGNHLLEAISHAICEVVERDSTARWGLLDDESRRRTSLDPHTIDDPDCLLVLEKFSRAGIALAVWETTGETGIPAFMCTINDANADPLRRLYGGSGMGCHPTREIALLRALTEAAQSRLTMISGSRDDVTQADFDRLRSPDAHARIQALIDDARPVRRFTDIPTWESESFFDDVEWELGRLRSCGIDQVIAVDLTREEFQIPVVRVVIPGLEDVLTGGGTASEVGQMRAAGRRALDRR